MDFSSLLSTCFIGTYAAVAVEREALPTHDMQQVTDVVGLRARLVGNGDWAHVLREPYPDWRSFNHLGLELVNTSPLALLMWIRIRNRNQCADRRAGYLGTIEIGPHSRTIHKINLQELTSAGASAVIDPALIRSLILTAHVENRAMDFYVTSIWLE